LCRGISQRDGCVCPILRSGKRSGRGIGRTALGAGLVCSCSGCSRLRCADIRCATRPRGLAGAADCHGFNSFRNIGVFAACAITSAYASGHGHAFGWTSQHAPPDRAGRSWSRGNDNRDFSALSRGNLWPCGVRRAARGLAGRRRRDTDHHSRGGHVSAGRHAGRCKFCCGRKPRSGRCRRRAPFAAAVSSI
jgi:hypothetical protein